MFGQSLAQRLADTTPRARALLAVLFLVFVPLLAVFALILPLAEARRDAARAVTQAEALHMWVYSQAAALPAAAFGAAPDPAPEATAGAVGISRLEQTLVAAGLRDRVGRLSNRRDGTVEIGFDAVPFRELTGWIAANSGNWGYGFAAFSVERGATSGEVSAVLELEPLE